MEGCKYTKMTSLSNCIYVCNCSAPLNFDKKWRQGWTILINKCGHEVFVPCSDKNLFNSSTFSPLGWKYEFQLTNIGKIYIMMYK